MIGKLFMFGFMVLILVGSVSAYYCINEEDNNAVKEFKSKMNIEALRHDIIDNQITQEALNLKLKYFTRCD